MNSSIAVETSLLPNLTTLRDLLNLLSSLRDLTDPFSSIDSLRKSLDLLAEFAVALGLDSKYLAWINAIESNSELLNLLLAAAHYLETLLAPTPTTLPITANDNIQIQSIDFSKLFPILTEILQLIQQLRTPTTPN